MKRKVGHKQMSRRGNSERSDLNCRLLEEQEKAGSGTLSGYGGILFFVTIQGALYEAVTSA